MKKVVLIGPFPPPVHGMSKNLKLFAEHIEIKRHTIKINTSPGEITRGLNYHFNKVVNVLNGVVKLFSLARKKSVDVIYMPPDAGFGAYYSLLFVIVARIYSIPIYLHHRSFAYINKKTFGMTLITRLEPLGTTHIFLCEKMKFDFEKIYGDRENNKIVSNAQYVKPVEHIHVNKDFLYLGHLSNLGFEKGLKQVFEVCELLESKGIKYKLELGGPAESTEVQLFLNEKLEKFKDTVNYHGLISHDKKELFYEKLDLFLFPSVYRNEAQPNVLFEANAAGVPVLSLHTGCIPTDISCDNGFVFSSQATFAEEALEIITHLACSEVKLKMLKESTLNKIKFESENAKSAYIELINEIIARV